MELCNNCGQYAPSDEINFAGFCQACQPNPKALKPYPPTDLEEGTRPLRADEYCADCGHQHGGYPGIGCGR